ncbi:MAG: endonuclease III domain-containing protein [Dehalococcoidia bacterium]
MGHLLLEVYHRLLARYGPQHWWPAEDPFEVIVGAILTQSAAWINVERAISNLKAAKALTPAALRDLPLDRLAHLVRPSGYYNAKAMKIKAFVERLRRYGDLERLFALDTQSLRQELLSIHGVGEETADSIILYAARKPVFVIDAYTRRILHRLGIAPIYRGDNYRALQALFTENLPQEEGLYNEYHALLVRHGKEVCRKVPLCSPCCLRDLCPY